MKTIKIYNYDVNKDDIFLYTEHFGKDKSDVFAWERMRKILHDNIFTQLNIDRHSDVGKKFGKELDRFCEPHILKYDAISVRAKELSNAETKTEIDMATIRLQAEMHMQKQRDKLGFRQFNVNDKSECRVCKIDMSKSGGRTNDHLATVDGFKRINNPICMDCSKNKPDDYYLAFRKQYCK